MQISERHILQIRRYVRAFRSRPGKDIRALPLSNTSNCRAQRSLEQERERAREQDEVETSLPLLLDSGNACSPIRQRGLIK
jgi:hypothetical protein